MSEDLPSAAVCRALLNPTDPASGTIDGMPFGAWWQRASPTDRRGWVEHAARFGVVPEGYVDFSIGLSPSMTLAPGAFCYRVIALDEQGAGVAGGSGEAGPGAPYGTQDDGREFGPRDRDLIARLFDWLRGLFERAGDLAGGLLRTITETVRNILSGAAGAAGSAALLLGLGLLIITGLYVATRNGGGARRGR